MAADSTVHGARLAGIADYVFVRYLGEGNYGTYHLAVPPDRLAGRREHVAVKVLAGNTTEDALHAIAKELRLFAAVSSEHLAQLLDAGQEGMTCYYAMEYHPLGSLSAPARPLSRQEVLAAVAQAARGAHALHEAGIAHRDIKPANVLLHEAGARLSDLGLAQLLAPGQTMTGMGHIGSVEYMDPGLIRGERASRASDVWALGVTLHRALTGSSVYGEIPDRDPLLGLRHVLKTTPVLDPSLSPEEAEIIRATLAADHDDRPATALMVAESIEQLLSEPAPEHTPAN